MANRWLAQYTPPDGTMLNGEFVVTISAGAMTIALKKKDGSNPTTASPVCLAIGGTSRLVSAALSVTVPAGTNTFNAGSAELATQEIDYFVYLAWRAASSAVVIGLARIPYARLYSDFSATETNEKYAAFSTAPAAGDNVCVIGRIAATLSAGAGYTWTSTSQSAPTNANTVQAPIFETRWLNWTPAYSCSGSLTYTSVTTTFARYKVGLNDTRWQLRSSGTLGGVASTEIRFTTPMQILDANNSVCVGAGFSGGVAASLASATGPPDLVRVLRYDGGNYPTSGTNVIQASGAYRA